MFSITWQGGSILYGYRHAADLVSWKYAAGYLTATIREADPFLLTQTPLTLVAPNGPGQRPLRRRLEDVTVYENTLTARVAPKG